MSIEEAKAKSSRLENAIDAHVEIAMEMYKAKYGEDFEKNWDERIMAKDFFTAVGREY
jgi:hypothetical protein